MITPLLRIENTNDLALCVQEGLGNFDEPNKDLAIHNCIFGSLCNQNPLELQSDIKQTIKTMQRETIS
jgi:hypothetical protein